MITINAIKSHKEANSYVTISEADDYCNTLYLAEDWSMLSNDDKARLLITATRNIDALKYAYSKYDDAQALMFPLRDEDTEIGWTDAKNACFIQAWYLYNNIEIIQSAISENIQNIQTQSIGKISTSKSTSGFNPFSKYDSSVYNILSSYLQFDNHIYRG